jgi:hypothetical protein
MLSGIKSLCPNSEAWKLVGPTKEVRGRRLLCSCQIRNGWYAGWLISSMGGHPIYFVWHNIAPFCFLILRSDRISLHYTSIYSCITIVYLLPHAYKPNSSVSSTLWILPTTKYKWGCQFKSSPFWLGRLALNQQTLFILLLNLSIQYQRQACILMSRVLWRLMLLLRQVYYQILRAYRLLSARQPRLPPGPARFHLRHRPERRPVPLYLLLFRIIRHN